MIIVLLLIKIKIQIEFFEVNKKQQATINRF